MDFQLIISRNEVEAPGLERNEIAPGVRLLFDPQSADLTFQLSNDRKVYLWGDVFYMLNDEGALLTGDMKSNLQRTFDTQALGGALQNIEGTFIGVLLDPGAGRIDLFSDRFARIDCFYSQTGQGLVASASLDFVFDHVTP